MAANETRPEVVVVGGSAGSIVALTELAAALPDRLSAAVAVVVHLPPEAHSYLPDILSRSGRLPASHPRDDEPLLPGHIYVAPPDHHLVIEDSRVRLNHGPRENGHRPAIDVLFRSAARWHGDRVVGVLLSGALSDGIDGLWSIKQAGGLAMVQDPAEALFTSMPAGALERVEVDYTRSAREIGSMLGELAGRMREAGLAPVRTTPTVPEEPMEDVEAGVPSVFSCPDCGGVLWELRDGAIVRYRCRVGHAFSPEGLDQSQQEHVEDAIWAALRALDERAELSARLAERLGQQGLEAAARRFDERAALAQRESQRIRGVLDRLVGAGGDANVPEPLRGEIELGRERDARRGEGLGGA